MKDDYRYDFDHPSFHGYGNDIKKIFAFRDFAFKHVFQRKFFAEFRFDKTLTDDEILSRLMQRQYIQNFGFKRDDDFLKDWFEQVDKKFKRDVTELEKSLDTLSDLQFLLEQYQKRINHHIKRLEKYTNTVATVIADDNTANLEKIKHRYKIGRGLKGLYWQVYREIKSLADKTEQAVKILDGEVQHAYRKIFANRLKSARQAAKLTQTEFGASVGLSQRVISGYEVASREPSLATLVKFAQKLKRPVGWFLGVE